MVLGFVFLLRILSLGLFGGTENEPRLVAINLAQEKMEEIRNKTYSSIANESKATLSTPFSSFQREVVVTTPQASLKQVSVNVYWFIKSDELNVGLVTYVSDI